MIERLGDDHKFRWAYLSNSLKSYGNSDGEVETSRKIEAKTYDVKRTGL